MTEHAEPLDSALEWVAAHTRRYVETDGAEGQDWRGLPILVLTTTGRKSGALRRNCLIYGRDGDDVLIVASYGGADAHPMWYLNLVAQPDIGLQLGADKLRARARTASPEEKRRLWPVMVGIYPTYADYQAKTSRDIPLVIATPLE